MITMIKEQGQQDSNQHLQLPIHTYTHVYKRT